MDKWKRIWSSKTLQGSQYSLSSLIKADGFDTNVGSYDEISFQKMVDDASCRACVHSNMRILEIGCGSGASLYALSRTVKPKMHGVDYSSNLIAIARQALPSATFEIDEAVNVNFETNPFDVIFSHSVFQYFPDVDYAYLTLQNIYKSLKFGGKLVLMDLNDASFQQIYENQRMQGYSDPDEYKKYYKGLDHLFFEKQALADFLSKLGFQEINFFPHAINTYGNSKFRFNLMAQK